MNVTVSVSEPESTERATARMVCAPTVCGMSEMLNGGFVEAPMNAPSKKYSTDVTLKLRAATETESTAFLGTRPPGLGCVM